MTATHDFYKIKHELMTGSLSLEQLKAIASLTKDLIDYHQDLLTDFRTEQGDRVKSYNQFLAIQEILAYKGYRLSRVRFVEGDMVWTIESTTDNKEAILRLSRDSNRWAIAPRYRNGRLQSAMIPLTFDEVVAVNPSLLAE